MSGIALRRLHAQRLTSPSFATAVDAVAWLGAVQSQDYAGAKWALGQRTSEVTDEELDRLFDAGAILRTHVMRPTWHFVLPDDVRWLLDLTGPRVAARLAAYDRQLDIDQSLLRRAYAVFEAALQGGCHLTRDGLAAALDRAGIAAAGQRLGHLVMHAEVDQVLVSGPRRGRQFTYALLAERAPAARLLERDEALAELALRYFTGHGPAQAQDCAWWSGLTLTDVRRGLALTGPALVHEVIDGRSYWSSPARRQATERAPLVHLLPNYDEFLVAYRDRTASHDPARELDRALFPRDSILAHVVLVNGRVWGGWRRRLQGGRMDVELGSLDGREPLDGGALRVSVERLSRFLGVPVSVTTKAV